jgi:D-alanyl-D-alanine carboxypeptidase
MRRHRLLRLVFVLALLGTTGLSATHPGSLTAAPATQAQTAPRPPAILAKSAYVLDTGSGRALFQKFPSQRRQMASTAKLMTGLLTVESGRLGETATVSRRAATVGETSMNLVEGERVAVLDLLYGLVLNSANDAAIVLAEHLGGSVETFVEQMNARAATLGLNDTQFGTPHGLDHAQFRTLTQYSSARDLAVLAATAMANPGFARAAGTTMRDVAGPPDKGPHRLRHTVSAVWWYPGVLGGKTGWTERAGQVRVVVAERLSTRLVAVVMDSPDNVREIRDLFDYGFAVAGTGETRALIPTRPDDFALPDARLAQAWERYKTLAVAPDGRVRRGATGEDATSDAQAAALLHAVWFRDRPAFDAIWGWTKLALSRRQSNPANGNSDSLLAGRWTAGNVTDWANSTAADQRIGAALLLASKLWNEPAYAADARPVLEAVLNKAAIAWQNTGVPAPTLGVPAANSILKEMEPATTSATTLTPAFYRMFTEGTRNATWLSLLDGAYITLERATGAGAVGSAGAAGSTLGGGAGLLPAWFSVSRQDGRVGSPVDPTWQSTGFGEASPALAWQLALDLRWSGEPRAKTVLAPTARILGRDLAQRRQIGAAYARGGGATGGAETRTYGALAGIALPEFDASLAPAVRARLEPGLTSADPDRILDAIDGLWLLAGGPPNYWRLWWPPEDLPTTRNDAVVPPPAGSTLPWRYFDQTGHVVQGGFLDYFLAGGGVDTFGLPRTDELQEDGRTVQYFQRGRMELAPERRGTGKEIEMAPLGRLAAQARGILARPEAVALPPVASDDAVTFVPETGHRLLGGFRDFYVRAGGAAVLGFPITEELVEDGVTVQYFERAVLEYVPGQAQPVRATLVGDQLLRDKGWLK